MVFGAQQVDDLLPHRNVRVCVSVANNVHTMLSTAEEHVYPILCPQETNFAVFIASDQRNDDDLGFFALEVVDGGNAQEIAQLLLLERLSLHLHLLNRVVLSRLFCAKSVFDQGVLVSIADNNLEIVPHRCPKLL